MAGNETLSVMIYLANSWSKEESIKIYGDILGNHIWSKWVGYNDDCNAIYANAKLIYELDSINLELLAIRATQLYNGRSNVS